MVRENGYQQLVSNYTTDNKTLIDHIYSNVRGEHINSSVLETYLSDHKAIRVSAKI